MLLLITACPPIPPIPPLPSAGRTASNQEAKPTSRSDRATSSRAGTAAPTETATTFFTPTPGATATATPTPLTTPDADAAATLAEAGRVRFVQSDLAGAETSAIAAIAADPSHLPAHFLLIDAYLYQPQKWQQALTAAETAVGLAPEDPTALAYLAWAQQSAHFFDDAKASAQRAVELGPELAITHQALADVLSSMYEIDAAHEAAQQAVDLAEENASVWASLGAIDTTLEELDNAGEAFAQAVELEPDFFAWHILLARHELNLTGDTEYALELAAPALEAQPEHPFVLAFLVDIALETNQWDEAEATCLKMMAYHGPTTLYPDAYSCMAGVKLFREDNQGSDYFQQLAEAIAPPQRRDVSVIRMRLLNDEERCDESRALAEAWLEERPYSVLALRMIGVSYLCDEDFVGAADYFQQALDLLPRSVADARLLANAYARDEKAAQARTVLNQIRAIAPESPLYFQAQYEVALFSGQTEEAIKAAQRWQVLRPTSSEAMVSLALAELFNNNVAAAQSNAENALEAGDSGSTVQAILGETYSRQGDFATAEEYLLRALAINEEHFLARNFIAQLYLLNAECEKAEPHVEWLQQENADNPETAAQYQQLLLACRERAQRFVPDPTTALDDAAVLRRAATALRTIGVESRNIEFAEDERQRSLFVAFSTDADQASGEFAALERAVVLELAKLLPLIGSQPDGLLVVSGAQDEPQYIFYVDTAAAVSWVNGELSDAEFEETWLKERAANLDEE
jgi:tetratricopeptide (TPR) repeat protein